MADVMVPGILMTYSGLNGILESQLSNPVINNGTLNSQTITYTSLQPGYFIFAGFVVYRIVLFAMLNRMSPRGRGPGRWRWRSLTMQSEAHKNAMYSASL